MADRQQDPLDPEQYLGLVRAALDPDERKFFKAHLGQESPDIGDYLLPQGRFRKARELREGIVKEVLSQTISNPRATVGEAQAMFPGFPAPPGATSPGPELEGPGAPVATGITPGQGFNQQEQQSPGLLPTRQDDFNKLLETRSRPFFEEGPRPTGPETVNENAVLPRNFQNLLNAKIHQSSLRSSRSQGVTPAELDLQNQARYRDLSMGAPEDYLGEKDTLRTLIGVTEKDIGPTGLKGQEKQVEIESKRAVLPTLAPQAGATLEKTRQETKDMAGLLQPKIDALIAKAKLDNLSGGQLGKKLFNAEQLLKLREGAENLNIFKVLDNRGMLPGDSSNVLLKSILSKIAPDLIASGMDPNFLQEFLGLGPSSGIQLAPKGDENPVPTAPTPTKDTFAGAPPGKNEGDTLKDGDKPVARWTNGKWQAIQ